MMATHVLGTTGDRILIVKKTGTEYIIVLRVKDDNVKYIEFPSKRWAAFRELVDDVNVSAKVVANGGSNIKLRQHVGGGYYVSVTSGFRCVDIRKFYKPHGSTEAEIKPTKRGVALRFDEFAHLCNLIEEINVAYPDLASAQPCFFDDDHLNQLGWLSCTECHPFGCDYVSTV